MEEQKERNYNLLYEMFREPILFRAELIAQKTAYYYDAEDIAQELFFKLFLEMDRYEGVKGPKENYFNKILKNEKTDILKRAWAQKNGITVRKVYLDQLKFDEVREESSVSSLHDVINVRQQSDVDELMNLNVLKEEIRQILKHPSLYRYRQVIVLYLYGYRQMEIAKHSKCSQATVSLKIRTFKEMVRERTGTYV